MLAVSSQNQPPKHSFVNKNLGFFPLLYCLLTTIYKKCLHENVLHSLYTGAKKKTPTQMDPGFIFKTTHLLTILLLHWKDIITRTFQHLTPEFSLLEKIYSHMTEMIHLFSMRKCYFNMVGVGFFLSLWLKKGTNQRRISYSKLFYLNFVTKKLNAILSDVGNYMF